MSLDEQLTRELDAVAGTFEPSPAPVAGLVAAGRVRDRRRRRYAVMAVAAVAAVALGTVWTRPLGDDDARRPEPAGPTGLDFPTGARPQVPIQVGGTTYVDGRALAGDYGIAVVRGFGAVAQERGTRRWHVLTEPGEPALPAGIIGTPAPHPDGDRFAYVDRSGSLVLAAFSGSGPSESASSVYGGVPLLEGMDAGGNVYFTPGAGDPGGDPTAELWVWRADGTTPHVVTHAGAPVSWSQVIAAGLVFSDRPGGPLRLGMPDDGGVVRESRAVPDVSTRAVSPSAARVAWLTDASGREPQGRAGWDGDYASVVVESTGDAARTRLDLPEGSGLRWLQWEDDTHLLLTLSADARGTDQSLLRCDVTEGVDRCEYAVPPGG